MAKLTTRARKDLPKKDFGLPGKVDKDGKNKAGRGSYPMPNKAHARVAKAYASKEENAGNLSPANKAKIDRKADKILGEKHGMPKGKAKDKRK